MENEGPWKKLDPVQLRKEAESKEAKLKRKQEARLARADARKEKRHEKSLAKQARRANVQRAAKWTPERRALDKQKKLSKHAHKEEKRRKRLRLKADKFEAQAAKLIAEAQKARARADLLDEKKAKEEEVKNKLSNEIKEMAADPENEDYIALDGATGSNGSSSISTSAYSEQVAKNKRQKDESLHEKALKEIMNDKLGPSITASGLHVEASKKKKQAKKAEEKAKRKATPDSDTSSDSSTSSDSDSDSDSDEDMEDAVPEPVSPVVKEEEVEETPKKSKDKKNKKKSKHVEEVKEEDSEDDKESRKEKKKKADKKRKREEPAADDMEVDEAPKDKKKKKSKKDSKVNDEPTSAAAPQKSEESADSGEQWNVQSLEGGDKRKEKFMRLLGAKKTNGAAPSNGTNGQSQSRSDISRMQQELEHQFNAGMEMKNKNQGHRRGLGA